MFGLLPSKQALGGWACRVRTERVRLPAGRSAWDYMRPWSAAMSKDQPSTPAMSIAIRCLYFLR